MRTSAVLVNTTESAKTKLYDVGNYSCVAKSKYGIDTREFSVIGKITDILKQTFCINNCDYQGIILI